jgi:hypothetical protein
MRNRHGRAWRWEKKNNYDRVASDGLQACAALKTIDGIRLYDFVSNYSITGKLGE